MNEPAAAALAAARPRAAIHRSHFPPIRGADLQHVSPAEPKDLTMSASRKLRPARPRIYVTDTDFETLSGLLTPALAQAPGAALLGEELARAATPPRDGRPFVKLGSRVWFEDLDTGQRREVQVCTPRDASIDDNRISALTPIGAALIGLEVGATFEWTGPDQRPRRIKALEVLEPPR